MGFPRQIYATKCGCVAQPHNNRWRTSIAARMAGRAVMAIGEGGRQGQVGSQMEGGGDDGKVTGER